MWPGDAFHVGWTGLWMMFWLVVLILLVSVVARAAGGSAWHTDETPEEILMRRYAHGEIGREEYERGLSDLQK